MVSLLSAPQRPASGTPAPAPAGRRRRRDLAPYLYLSPTAIVMLVLMLVPVLLVIGYSFFDNVITNPKPAFVGLANYLEVLGDPKFRTATGNTIVFVGVSVAAHLVLGLGFAMLLNSPLVPTVAKSLFRVVYVLPWLFTVAIIAVLWRLLLNPNGVINYALISLGLTDKGIEWLASPATALLSVTFINIWAGYSFYMITLLAGLQGIPHDLYEAAKVDGASAWQRFWNVTIPQLKPIIISMSVLDIIWTSQQFALIWMTTGGGPIDATEMLSTYTYKLAFSRYEFSVASASAVLILLLTMVLAFFYVRNQKARD
ncbi:MULTISPECIES: carbohydrate ABC transporter permease [Rathayibacter]|uniref:carbohydrate ABC transporter permease n=1 Tax=Rathayibacter TaxID=33886 RepID=UPI000FA28391|nr:MULTISPECIES: sugar ABC transporter permease [Rathayibacter]MCJ1682263.1 sugar ABC transporter permease [Rathayibacter sp. VKM Ac-2928]MCJ1699521.1 sugar ABC transporter permease [Rathayibacter festucae]ROP57597.1 multiple sugar transport system permease protein [Rathayibacter sp. PhB186]ROS55982.1 multiple sugar transport system permease protein [Rathayibacter sp. PhB185]